jgi:hypothetical protein
MKQVVQAIIGILLCASFTPAQAQSQTVYKYDADTIDSSIKCELSRVARFLGKQKPGGPAMIAIISVSGTETTTKKVGGGVGLFGSFGGSYETSIGRTRGAKGPRNINVDNKINCKKSFVVDVGLFSCFQEQKRLFLEGQTISCSDTSTASSAVNAGGKFDLWVLNVNLSGDYVKKREWKIEVSAPPEKK